jgi:hypothetical protein
MYSYGVGRAIERGEREMVADLQKSFAAEGYRVPELMRHIASSEQFYRVAKPSADKPASDKSKTEASAQPATNVAVRE